jgi:predicted DNA binding CopG/RHH family protein
MPKRRIDFSDIPELSDEQLKTMRRVGRPPLGRAARTAISVRVDPHVLARLKATAAKRGVPYQSLINDILARAMRRAG